MSRHRRPRRPHFARLLRLRHLRLSGLVSLLLFEGTIALAVVLALAEIVSWWGVLALPATVALMVKINDVVAGAVGGGRRGSSAPRGQDAAAGPMIRPAVPGRR